MKKFISMTILLSVFAIPVFTQTPINFPNPNCTSGHINTPVLVCVPPSQGRAGGDIENGSSPVKSDDSMLTIIKTFIAEYNTLVYLLN